MPAIVLLLGIAAATAAFKMYLLDRRTTVKPTHSAANTPRNFAILDAELYGYENAVVQNRASLLTLYGDGLLLDSSLVVNTYSNRLSPEVREAMQRTNFDLNAHVTQSMDSNNNLTGRLLIDPVAILRSRTNRTNFKVDISGDLMQVAVLNEGETSTAPSQFARYDRGSSERPQAQELEPARTYNVPRISTTTSIGRSGIERTAAPPDPNELFAKAARLYTSGDLKSAEELCLRLKRDSPGLKGVSNLLGEIHARHNKWDDALKEFEEAIKEDPSRAEYHNNIGSAYAIFNKNDLAEEHLIRAQKLDPMNGVIMLNCAEHFRRVKRFQDSLKYLDLALIVNPKNAQAKRKRTQALLNLERFKEVEEILNGQLAANPRDVQTILMMAILHTRQGDAKGAVEWLQKAESDYSRPKLLDALEKLTDFELIKDTPEYKEYLASLKPVP